jgi:hypothetical protein
MLSFICSSSLFLFVMNEALDSFISVRLARTIIVCSFVYAQSCGCTCWPCTLAWLVAFHCSVTPSSLLQKKRFVLKVELHKWLERLEKENGEMMDRKTLARTLNKLQQEGSCKCIKVSVPLVTNYTRSRLIDVILHYSVGNLSAELVH